MKDSGSTIRPMVWGHTPIPTEPSMLENGRMTSKMGWEFRNGWTENDMKENTKTAQNVEKES
jgi:hypothetical protein